MAMVVRRVEAQHPLETAPSRFGFWLIRLSGVGFSADIADAIFIDDTDATPIAAEGTLGKVRGSLLQLFLLLYDGISAPAAVETPLRALALTTGAD
jgi:hypothetical protein